MMYLRAFAVGALFFFSQAQGLDLKLALDGSIQCLIVNGVAPCWGRFGFMELPVHEPKAIVSSAWQSRFDMAPDICAIDGHKVSCFLPVDPDHPPVDRWDAVELTNPTWIDLRYPTLSVVDNGRVHQWIRILGFPDRYEEIKSKPFSFLENVKQFAMEGVVDPKNESMPRRACALFNYGGQLTCYDINEPKKELFSASNVRDFSLGLNRGCALAGDDVICFGEGFDRVSNGHLICARMKAPPRTTSIYLVGADDPKLCAIHAGAISCVNISPRSDDTHFNCDPTPDWKIVQATPIFHSIGAWRDQAVAWGDDGLVYLSINRNSRDFSMPERLKQYNFSDHREDPAALAQNLRILSTMVYSFDRDWYLELATQLSVEPHLDGLSLWTGFLLVAQFRNFGYPGVQPWFVKQMPEWVTKWGSASHVTSIVQIPQDLRLRRFAVDALVSLLKTTRPALDDSGKKIAAELIAELGSFQALPNDRFMASFNGFFSSHRPALTQFATQVAGTPYVSNRAAVILEILKGT